MRNSYRELLQRPIRRAAFRIDRAIREERRRGRSSARREIVCLAPFDRRLKAKASDRCRKGGAGKRRQDDGMLR